MTSRTTGITAPPARTPVPPAENVHTILIRSTAMYSLHEALAREHQREMEQRSREARLAKQAAAERRYHRASLRHRRSPRR